jgi:hypothetical protein
MEKLTAADSVCLVSIIRAVFLSVAVKASASDPNRTYIAITKWSLVEVNISVVVPCLVVLRHLVSRFWPSFLSRQGGGSDPDRKGQRGGVPVSPGRMTGPGGAELTLESQSSAAGGSSTLSGSRAEKGSLYEAQGPVARVERVGEEERVGG